MFRHVILTVELAQALWNRTVSIIDELQQVITVKLIDEATSSVEHAEKLS